MRPPPPPATNLCGMKGSQATTLLFNPDAATILNTRMPLTLLAEAAEDKSLPRNLSFQIAQSTWTRAVLLNQPDIAKRMSPILTGCYPAWKQWLEGYDNAANANDRHVAGLLALMRFPSNTPSVGDGERSDGFAGYSEYRDNWWGASTDAKPSTADNPNGTPETFFGTQPATRATLPDPPFLTRNRPHRCRSRDRRSAHHALLVRLLRRRRARLAETASRCRPAKHHAARLRRTRRAQRLPDRGHPGAESSPLRHRANKISKE